MKKKNAIPGEFKRLVRELEVDESENAFDKALGKIGKAKGVAPSPKRDRE